jgi:hypothetical protein
MSDFSQTFSSRNNNDVRSNTREQGNPDECSGTILSNQTYYDEPTTENNQLRRRYERGIPEAESQKEECENILRYPSEKERFYFNNPINPNDRKAVKKQKYHHKIVDEKQKHQKWKARFYQMKKEQKELLNNYQQNQIHHYMDSFGRELKH